MIKLFVRLVLNSVAILITGYLTPGVIVDEFVTALVVTVVFDFSQLDIINPNLISS